MVLLVNNVYYALFFWLLIVFCTYTGFTIFYYSTAPLSVYDCPNIQPNAADFSQTTINDASCLNQTTIHTIVSVKSIEDIRNALETAHKKNLYVSIAGRRHSMGGQAFFKNALVIDMREFNQILSLDEKSKTLTVQSGCTWHDIQNFLNSKNLAVKAMQSTDIFTVGGSLSVNAHGMDHNVGALAGTINSFTIMLADGTIRKVTPNEELFNSAIGGYGLFGVIIEVELQVTDNVMYKQEITVLPVTQFPAYFDTITKNGTYDLFYGHLSTSPLSFFKQIIVYGYKRVSGKPQLTELRAGNFVKVRRFLLNLSKKRWYAQIAKWFAEKYIDPYITLTRKEPFISRNQIMHDSVEYLENIISDDTDILQEYFIPKDKLAEFIITIGAILQKRNALVLNASIRFVNQEFIMLNYAPQPMFAIVLYLNQKVTKQAVESMKALTKELIDATLKLDGTFFLPYQLYFTKEQLVKAYPSINSFFKLKRKYDPNLLFMNNFYARYAPEH